MGFMFDFLCFQMMNRLIFIVLGILLLLNDSCAIKKKYLDSDMDGVNDAEDDDDDEDEDDDGDGVDNEDEDTDGDGVANKDDEDDDGDGIHDSFDKDDDGDDDAPVKKTKGSSGSGPWGTLVFGYYFGLTQYILKTMSA